MTTSTVLGLGSDHRRVHWMNRLLQSAGYPCHWVANSAEAVDQVRSLRPSLLLLDGVENASAHCMRNVAVLAMSPVPILLTAAVGTVDRAFLMDSADDFICAPINPQELLLRVRKLLAQRPRPAGHAACAASESSDLGCIRANGHHLALTRTEARLLQALVLANGRVLSREHLMSRLHVDGRDVADRSIDSHVKNLRRKLDQTGCRHCIRCVYGVGFHIDAAACRFTFSSRAEHVAAPGPIASGGWDRPSAAVAAEGAFQSR